MEKCAICGLETDDLYECDYCGRLVCEDCGGKLFECDDCYDERKAREDRF